MKINPLEIAINVSKISTNTSTDTNIEPKTKTKKVSEFEHSIWDVGGERDINLFVPVDGWNNNHWKKLFADNFRNIYGHFYTGRSRLDTIVLSEIFFKCKNELEMPNSEIKEFFEWVFNTKMTEACQNGEQYFIARLKYDILEFYNSKIHPRKISDKRQETKQRDLIINNEDLRESIEANIVKVDNNIDLDNRLLIQLGISIIYRYLEIQESLGEESIDKILKNCIGRILQEDFAKNENQSDRFERIIKSTVGWEPYPWTPVNWRKNWVRNIVSYLKYDTLPWWREEYSVKIKPISCLKLLNHKKKNKRVIV